MSVLDVLLVTNLNTNCDLHIFHKHRFYKHNVYAENLWSQQSHQGKRMPSYPSKRYDVKITNPGGKK